MAAPSARLGFLTEEHMSIQIEGGIVSVEDGNKGDPNDYNPRRKVRVELHFSAEHADLNAVSNLASSEVARLLGRTETAAAADTKPATTRKKADKPAAEPAAPPAPAEPDFSVTAETPARPAEPAAPPAREYPDRELKAAMGAKFQETQDAVAIRNLVKTFRPADWTNEFSADNIPQERRREFLKKLEGLHKA